MCGASSFFPYPQIIRSPQHSGEPCYSPSESPPRSRVRKHATHSACSNLGTHTQDSIDSPHPLFSLKLMSYKKDKRRRVLPSKSFAVSNCERLVCCCVRGRLHLREENNGLQQAKNHGWDVSPLSHFHHFSYQHSG